MSSGFNILNKFDLLQERDDFIVVHDEIESGISFRGTNLWVLIFAIIIASVGLNVNSTAVIIGAMLISPLMGPIIGVGYGIATYDFKMLKSALRNYIFAMIAGLCASALYFALTPINAAQSELLSRTSPNIYDVLIALFGGFAGIVVLASKRKGNVVSGVAIATALMPPLCTAGYGLAMGNWSFFFGALYLYTINSVFIAVATMVTTRFYRFPVASYLSDKAKRKANYLVYFIVLFTALPSLYFGYRLVKFEEFKQHAQDFISNETNIPNEFLLKQDVDPVNKVISLVFGGKGLSEQTKESIRQAAKNYALEDAKIVVSQSFSLIDTEKEMSEADKLRGELSNTMQIMQGIKLDYDSLNRNQVLGAKLQAELQVWEPSIKRCYANFATTLNSDSTTSSALIFIAEAKEDMESQIDPSKIKKWLQTKYPKTKLIVEVTYR